MSPCEILIQSTRLDNAEESHEHRRVFPSEEIGSSRTAWWWTSDAGIIQVGSHFSIKFVSGFFPTGRGLKKAVAPKQGKWLTVIFGYLIHLVLPNPVIVIADLRPFSKLIGFFVAFLWREFIFADLRFFVFCWKLIFAISRQYQYPALIICLLFSGTYFCGSPEKAAQKQTN